MHWIQDGRVVFPDEMLEISVPMMRNGRIENNSAAMNGGGLYNRYGTANGLERA